MALQGTFDFGGQGAVLAFTLVLAAFATVIALALRSARNKRMRPGFDTADEPVAGSAADAGFLAGAIQRAEVAGDSRSLPGLYLTLARVQVADRKPGEAAETLRRGIRIAAQLGERETHALARLELGDLAQAEGDLTSACEHWQIARGLFQELGQPNPLAVTEARMQTNRCPTDWVLNEF